MNRLPRGLEKWEPVLPRGNPTASAISVTVLPRRFYMYCPGLTGSPASAAISASREIGYVVSREIRS